MSAHLRSKVRELTARCEQLERELADIRNVPTGSAYLDMSDFDLGWAAWNANVHNTDLNLVGASLRERLAPHLKPRLP